MLPYNIFYETNPIPSFLYSFFFPPSQLLSLQVKITPLAILISFISHFSSDTHNFQFSNFSPSARTISTCLSLALVPRFPHLFALLSPIVFIEHEKMHCILYARRVGMR